MQLMSRNTSNSLPDTKTTEHMNHTTVPFLCCEENLMHSIDEASHTAITTALTGQRGSVHRGSIMRHQNTDPSWAAQLKELGTVRGKRWLVIS